MRSLKKKNLFAVLLAPIALQAAPTAPVIPDLAWRADQTTGLSFDCVAPGYAPSPNAIKGILSTQMTKQYYEPREAVWYRDFRSYLGMFQITTVNPATGRTEVDIVTGSGQVEMYKVTAHGLYFYLDGTAASAERLNLGGEIGYATSVQTLKWRGREVQLRCTFSYAPRR